MKKARRLKSAADDPKPERHFDYSKAKPNRFAGRVDKKSLVVMLDPDVAAVFTTPESVNEVLRALISTMAKTPARKLPT
jgi:hypothetical protein